MQGNKVSGSFGVSAVPIGSHRNDAWEIKHDGWVIARKDDDVTERRPNLARPALQADAFEHSAQVGCNVTWDTETNKVRIVFHRIFQPSAKEPLNFEATIAHTVRDLTSRFAVRGVFYDPFQMAAVAQGLQRVGVPMREVPQTPGTLTEIGTNLFELIKARGLVAYPDAALRLAISRAVAVETPRGWKISKEKQAHKIDVVVALAMAAHAAVLGSRVPPQPNIHVPIDLSVASYGPLPGSMSDSWSPPYNW